MIRFSFLCCLILVVFGRLTKVQAEVQPVLQYNLKGAGGIRDTAAPEMLKNQAQEGPDLKRIGSPKVMSNGPEPRRKEYDSSVKFEEGDQCYSVAKNLIGGSDFVLEVWVYAAKANDGGYHTIVANGSGGSGFLIVQSNDQWKVLVGGVGDVSLGKVRPEVWTHLAIVQSRGFTSGWMDGKKTCKLPGVGGGAANFSIGASSPGKEPFQGWIAEVRYCTFKPGKFDPATDFLMDRAKLKILAEEDLKSRKELVATVLKTPGIKVVSKLDERPATADWLIARPTTTADIQVVPNDTKTSARVMLSNGLISRTFLVHDNNLACTSLRRSDKQSEFIRAIKPEVRFRVNGSGWVEVGGLTGAPDKSFLTEGWIENLESKDNSFVFNGMTVGENVKPYEWTPKCNAVPTAWPAAGQRLTFHFAPPAKAVAPLKNLRVDVHYEIYDGLPVMMKTFTVHNGTGKEIVVNEINVEYLAVNSDQSPMLHCESDYSFAAANFNLHGSALGIHVQGGTSGPWVNYYMGQGTTRWEADPDWGSMATLNPAEDIFLKNPQQTLLVSKPPVGPGLPVKSGERFEAFRTFEILNDTTEKERKFLAQRQFYKKLAPQTTEHQLEVHCPSRNTATLKAAMDQMAELGFERLQIEHPVGISYGDISEGNIRWLKEICDYGKSKGIRVGGYELMMASQGRGAENNCIIPGTKIQGSIFGQSGCGCSKWGETYAKNLWTLVDATGLGSFNPDGPYHGDPCASTEHPGHRGLEDSQWTQWKYMTGILAEGQRRNLYLTIPDWYFLKGQVCTGMGYREATDNIDIVLQTVIYRQYIFDATFHKTAGMGWVNLNTGVLRGGHEKNLNKYERQFFGMIASGAQLWVRGHALYDGPESKAMVDKWVKWYRKYTKIIQGDIIHLRRPDGRDLDYYLHVAPENKEKGMLLVFNPTDQEVAQTLNIPLYYTGLTETAQIREQEKSPREFKLDREFKVKLPVSIPANGYTWLIIE